jgi:hypothetical protein
VLAICTCVQLLPFTTSSRRVAAKMIEWMGHGMKN